MQSSLPLDNWRQLLCWIIFFVDYLLYGKIKGFRVVIMLFFYAFHIDKQKADFIYHWADKVNAE